MKMENKLHCLKFYPMVFTLHHFVDSLMRDAIKLEILNFDTIILN